MKAPKLIVMAAGLGSRFGGLKQMESITDQNEIILDFAVYDAMKAGFRDVIFIIKPEMEELFNKKVMRPMKKYLNVQYVLQDINQLPKGYSVPKGRTKPWGTCHAVMAAKKFIDGPFAVINADDYYGRDAFKKVYDFLCKDTDDYSYCMAGYYIENTLSEQGTVTRGICKIDKNANLMDIEETKEIGWSDNDIIAGNGKNISKGTVVSMNFWGFKPSMMTEMINRFPDFLNNLTKEGSNNKEEYLLPIEVGRLLNERKITVKVLEATDKWYGVTYKEDKDTVYKAFKKMKEEGKYPKKLWP